MFARTENLLLRPGWSEDAPGLARVIAHGWPTHDLCWGRWPTETDHVDHWLRHGHELLLPRLLIFSRTQNAPELIGGIGLHGMADGSAELDFWVSPERRNRGFATEAAHAMLGMAKALGLPQLTACVFSENGAAARVLEKIGYRHSDPVMRRSAMRPMPTLAQRFARTLMGQRNEAPLLAA